jgi:hypothetical protein
MFSAPEEYRIKNAGRMSTTKKNGNNGLFVVGKLNVLCSDGGGWDHVSVSLPYRTPTWDEMCEIKDLFWSTDETVVQFHPRYKEYVNKHEHRLHLWRDQNLVVSLPPTEFV